MPVRRWLPCLSAATARHDDAQDDVPVFRQAKGRDRLDVERRAGRLAIADAEIPVALKGHADQAGDGILRLLRQLLGALREGCRRRKRQHQENNGYLGSTGHMKELSR